MPLYPLTPLTPSSRAAADMRRARNRRIAVAGGVLAMAVLGGSTQTTAFANNNGSAHPNQDKQCRSHRHVGSPVSLYEAAATGERVIGGKPVSVELEAPDTDGPSQKGGKNATKGKAKEKSEGKPAQKGKHGKKPLPTSHPEVWEVEIAYGANVYEVQLDPKTGCVLSGPRLED